VLPALNRIVTGRQSNHGTGCRANHRAFGRIACFRLSRKRVVRLERLAAAQRNAQPCSDKNYSQCFDIHSHTSIPAYISKPMPFAKVEALFSGPVPELLLKAQSVAAKSDKYVWQFSFFAFMTYCLQVRSGV
jgi:hypothetical protein